MRDVDDVRDDGGCEDVRVLTGETDQINQFISDNTHNNLQLQLTIDHHSHCGLWTLAPVVFFVVITRDDANLVHLLI